RPSELLVVATFSLGNERYALETRYIREIARFTDYAPVAGAADFLVGITSLHGEILAVVDLRRFFGVPARGLTDLSRIVVLGAEHGELGLLADQAHEIAVLRLDELLPPLDVLPGGGRQYVRGVTRQAVVALDGALLL